MFFWNFCFFSDPVDVGNLISGSSAFSKTSLNIWKFMVLVLLKPGLRILSITLLACEMSAIVQQFEHSLTLPFLGIGVKTDNFQPYGHYWVFQICWHIKYSTFTASSFRIRNSSAGIPSPPLTLLIAMLPKAHLTSHSRISGSRWVITPSWLSWSWRSFSYSSSKWLSNLEKNKKRKIYPDPDLAYPHMHMCTPWSLCVSCAASLPALLLS